MTESATDLPAEKAAPQVLPVRFGALWKAAWQAIKGKIGPAFLIFLLSAIISFVVTSAANVLSAWVTYGECPWVMPLIVEFVIDIGVGICLFPLTLGAMLFFLHQARGEAGDVVDLFEPYKRFLHYVCVYLCVTFRILAYTLLFVIPGIVAACRYLVAFYVALENPDLSAGEAIAVSCKLMKGYKARAFGYLLLWGVILVFGGVFTLGIGLIWLIPIARTFFAKFYVAVKAANSDDVVADVKADKKIKKYGWVWIGIAVLLFLLLAGALFRARSFWYLVQGACYVQQGDEKIAVKWFLKSADLGNAEAQTLLGLMYLGGNGVEENKAEAAMWFRKAADRNFADAQYWLGVMLLEGDGIEKNEEEGRMWLNKAAAQGQQEAKTWQQYEKYLDDPYGCELIEDSEEGEFDVEAWEREMAELAQQEAEPQIPAQPKPAQSKPAQPGTEPQTPAQPNPAQPGTEPQTAEPQTPEPQSSEPNSPELQKNVR